MRYRGMLRNEYVEYYDPTWHNDGCGGVYPEYGASPTIARYLCRLYFSAEEKVRDDPGAEQSGAWVMIGDPAAMVEGGKVVRGTQEFVITMVRKPRAGGMVTHHQRVVMRRVDGVGSPA